MNRRRIAGAFAASTLTVGIAAAGLLTAGAASAAAPAAPTAHDPKGALDLVQFDAQDFGLIIKGWAGDPDSAAGQRIHLYVDGVAVASIGNGATRNDVAKVYPSLGSKTGWITEVKAPLGRGSYDVCAYAINQGPGNTVNLGCKSVKVTYPGVIKGHIDSIATDPTDPTRWAIRGWALDPFDAVSPTSFSLIEESDTSGTPNSLIVPDGAKDPRPDVDKAYPHNGTNHGFVGTTPKANLSWAAGDSICLVLPSPDGKEYDDTYPTCTTISADKATSPDTSRSGKALAPAKAQPGWSHQVLHVKK